MQEYNLELDGMQCGSCEALIKRLSEANGAIIREIDANKGHVKVACENENILALIKQKLAEKGFGEKKGETTMQGHERGDFGRVKEYIFSVVAGGQHVKTETKLMNYAIGSAAALILAMGATYAFLPGVIPNAFSYLPMFVLAIIASVTISSSYFHVLCYRKGMSCSNGMMAGMTMGMISGFMAGALIGATNGMFMGSVAGILAGVALGGNLGRCCGVMGALEGVMAGLMGGIMGAMTSLMLLADSNILVFLYFVFGICSLVLGGLSYMMYRESGAAAKAEFKTGFARFFGASAVFALALAIIMIHAPKGLLVYQ